MLYCFCYLPYTRYGKGVFRMEILISIAVAVMAGVIQHFICKWLDGDR